MEMNLKNREWREFKIKDLFEIDKGEYLNKSEIHKGTIPYITAKSENNGTIGFISNSPLFDGNCITIEKINLTAYYQKYKFYCSHDVTVIRNVNLNEDNALFICNMINRQASKYSYGRQAQLNVIKSETVFLPLNNHNQPDFDYMETYIKDRKGIKLNAFYKHISKRLEVLQKREKIDNLIVKNWSEFFFNEIFTIYSTSSGIDKNKLNLKKDLIPYLTRTEKNNGIDLFLGDQNVKYKKDKPNVIIIGLDTQTVFYQPYSFYTGQNIQILENINLNKYIAIFLIPLIKRQMEKFNWGGNGATLSRLKRSKIMLPINENKEPDYEYMENYMKQLEFKKLKKYLEYKNSQITE